ncbi:MAG TPA: hypothetical protein VM098_02920 [Phycisphaerae bacterium]|nr:hypothetical protein [Phycisphaerae bacterium]
MTEWEGKNLLCYGDNLTFPADPQSPNPRCLQIPGGTAQHTLPEAPRHRGRRDKQAKLWEGSSA